MSKHRKCWSASEKLKIINKSLLFIFLFLPCFLFSQEVCDNGIDDDGDLLIDLNDSDCFCDNTYSLLPNYSFEDTLCCPFAISLMSCLIDWIQPSEATSDFFHYCDVFGHQDSPEVPLPLPNGIGFVGILNGGLFDGLYKEYVGTCIPLSLNQDSCYILDFYIGFGLKTNSSVSSTSPFDINIYGNSDCTKIPFQGTHCPLESDTEGWKLLSAKTVIGNNEWIRVTMEINPDENIEAIVIGPDCEETAYGQDRSYYYLDAISLYEKNNAPLISVDSGLPCLENVTISIPYISDLLSYQWYFNGTAIVGAIGESFIIPEGEDAEGVYQVMIQTSESCFTSPPYYYEINGFPIANLGSRLTICQDEDLLLGSDNLGEYYQWSTGDTTQTISISLPGDYSVTVTNECGSSTAAVDILEDPNFLCSFVTPNAFTPDGDGINDSFGPLTMNCCFKNYNMQIFSRWGKIVFESNNLNVKWNGNYKGKPVPSDVYLWKAIYELEGDVNSNKIKKAGDITLIR